MSQGAAARWDGDGGYAVARAVRSIGGTLTLAAFAVVVFTLDLGASLQLRLDGALDQPWRLLTGHLTHCRRVQRRAGTIDPAQVDPRPFVTGKQLKELGMKDGPRMGHLVHVLYDAQLNEEFSTRRTAMKRARALVAEEPK